MLEGAPALYLLAPDAKHAHLGFGPSPPLAARGSLTARLALRGRRPEVLDCMKSDRAADRVRAQTPGGNVMYATPCVFH